MGCHWSIYYFSLDSIGQWFYSHAAIGHNSSYLHRQMSSLSLDVEPGKVSLVTLVHSLWSHWPMVLFLSCYWTLVTTPATSTLHRQMSSLCLDVEPGLWAVIGHIVCVLLLSLVKEFVFLCFYCLLLLLFGAVTAFDRPCYHWLILLISLALLVHCLSYNAPIGQDGIT